MRVWHTGKDVKMLSVKGLSVAFGDQDSRLHAVKNLDLKINDGEIVGLIGESGSGKTTAILAMLGLLRSSPGLWAGSAKLGGTPLTPEMKKFIKSDGEQIKKKQLLFQRTHNKIVSQLLGKDITAIFQEPKAALDPHFSIGEHLTEALKRRNPKITREEIQNKSEKLLQEVGLNDAPRILPAYPHEISGGMAQRVMVALALAAEPKLLIADEPTTSLDVTTQAKLLELFLQLRQRLGLAMLIISHDMGVIHEITDRVYVMHRGILIEHGRTKEILSQPRHPYTAHLLESFVHFGSEKKQPPQKAWEKNCCPYRNICRSYLEASQEKQKKCDTQSPDLSVHSHLDHEKEKSASRCHFPEEVKLHENIPGDQTNKGLNVV